MDQPCYCGGKNPSWKIVPESSQITFTATQNHAPVQGNFKTFTGEINFDKEQLDKSNVNIAIDIASLFSSNSDIIKTLLEADWFDVKDFPKAVFSSNEFTKDTTGSAGEERYKAKGSLTIRDKTVPVTVSFAFKEYSSTKAQALGSTSIKRTDFGVGQGEWSSPTVVEDGVQVNFTVTAIKNQ